MKERHKMKMNDKNANKTKERQIAGTNKTNKNIEMKKASTEKFTKHNLENNSKKISTERKKQTCRKNRR